MLYVRPKLSAELNGDFPCCPCSVVDDAGGPAVEFDLRDESRHDLLHVGAEELEEDDGKVAEEGEAGLADVVDVVFEGVDEELD